MPEPRRLTDEELAEIRRRRPGVRASLACEGMYLTAEEEALFEQMDNWGIIDRTRGNGAFWPVRSPRYY